MTNYIIQIQHQNSLIFVKLNNLSQVVKLDHIFSSCREQDEKASAS